jgi:hypothetical protein
MAAFLLHPVAILTIDYKGVSKSRGSFTRHERDTQSGLRPAYATISAAE